MVVTRLAANVRSTSAIRLRTAVAYAAEGSASVVQMLTTEAGAGAIFIPRAVELRSLQTF